MGSSRGKHQRGFYDLTRARTQESGSITRVEEFGLSSVSEEANDAFDDDAERPVSASPDSGKASANGSRTLRGNLKRKTVSSDDILESSRTRLPPVSFSMDKLCSDTENDETTATPAAAATAATAETSRDNGGKGGLIKRRMLGSIRGLMASTHLLQTCEIDEVPTLLRVLLDFFFFFSLHRPDDMFVTLLRSNAMR